MRLSNQDAVSSTPFDCHDLKKNFLFKGLSEEVCREIFERGRVKTFTKNASLFQQGDTARELFIILEGRIKIFQVGEDGNQVLLRVLGKGQLVAGVAALENGVYPGNGIAIEKIKILTFDKISFLSLIARHSVLALNVVQLLLGRIAELQERFREISTERVEKRIARTLIRLAHTHGVSSSEGLRIDFPLTRQDLAEFAGTTLFTVSRLLKGWEGKGILKSLRKKIILLKPEWMKGLVEKDPL